MELNNEIEELEDDLVEDVEEEKASKRKVAEVKHANEFVEIVKKECARIHKSYVDSMKMLGTDTAFINSLAKEGKSLESCINHIMNNLTELRIYGGDDSLMHQYIHDYYVDKFTNVSDKWSSRVRTPMAAPTLQQVARGEAKDSITEEEKKKFYQEALEQAKKDAELKARADFQAKEAKRIAKEKELAEKKKAEEAAKKEAERIKREAEKEAAKKSGAYEQVSLFDL